MFSKNRSFNTTYSKSRGFLDSSAVDVRENIEFSTTYFVSFLGFFSRVSHIRKLHFYSVEWKADRD